MISLCLIMDCRKGSFAEAVKWWIGEKMKTPPEDVADDYLKLIGYEREASGNRCSRNNLEGKD